ncbi:MAG: sn-glycerol 3-phosphate transport system ATP-binding protein [Cocleimonas sp.]|jgi:sn-glycerol 3-phosphate transport system ATP-binding protein
MTSVVVKDVCKTWGDVKAVENVSFTVPAETFTVLLGPSGCGKSTLLRMVCGLEEVTSGSVNIGDRDVTEVEASDRGISMVFQSYALFPHLSVRENIQFGLKVRKVPSAEREKLTLHAAEITGLSELLDRKPSNLSGGQRQRVALARTIVSEQSVCLMDEPLSNLDSKLRAEMRDEIRGLQQRLGLTVLYVTHDQIEAMSMADQIILLSKGKVVQKGTPQELYNTPANEFVAKFIGTPPMNIISLSNIVSKQFINDFVPDALTNTNSIGIRPEHMSISENGLPVEVSTVEYLGGESVARLNHNDSEISMRISGQHNIKRGDKLIVSWDKEDTHFFDQNKERITTS